MRNYMEREKKYFENEYRQCFMDDQWDLMWNVVEEMLNAFSRQGHSGFSASYATAYLDLFLHGRPVGEISEEKDNHLNAWSPKIVRGKENNTEVNLFFPQVIRVKTEYGYKYYDTQYTMIVHPTSGEHWFTDISSKEIELPYKPNLHPTTFISQVLPYRGSEDLYKKLNPTITHFPRAYDLMGERARRELDALFPKNEDSMQDSMQDVMIKDILEIINIFELGLLNAPTHSIWTDGKDHMVMNSTIFGAVYYHFPTLVADIFLRLVRYLPLTLLTGADDEWNEISDNSYQNSRCPHIFKDGKDDIAYNIEGARISDDGGYTWFTNYSCRRDVYFPYNPSDKPEDVYIERDKNDEDKYDVITNDSNRIEILYNKAKKESDERLENIKKQEENE